MAIPLKERTKVQQLVGRIQAGAFDANDVDGLLIKLRPYAGSRSVFREIADFVAHPDVRDKGVACRSMTAFADAMRFFVEYVGAKRPLDVTQPFPAYVYRLFLSQAKLSDERELRARFHMSHATLINKIESNFVADKATKMRSLRPQKSGQEFIAALQYVVGFIHSKPAFHMSAFHTEFTEVLHQAGIAFEEELFSAHADRVSLAILCLVAGTEIVLPEGQKAKCNLNCESHFRILQGRRRLLSGVVTTEPSTFGHLQIMGDIVIAEEGKPPLHVTYPLITTELDPHTHVAPELFLPGAEPNEFGEYVVEVLDFSDNMALGEDFKLMRSPAIAV